MGIPLVLSESPAPPASYSGNSVDSESPPTPHFDEKNSAATFLHQKTIPTVWIESENSEDQHCFDKKTDQDQSCLQNTIPTVWIQPENSEGNQELQRFDEKNNQVCLQNTIPTVWIQPENSENQQLCFDSEKTDLLRYTPTCVSDFNLAWVQFVMQQYYEANFDKKNIKPPTVRRFTVGMAGANPDENEKASKGYVHYVFKKIFLSNWLG